MKLYIKICGLTSPEDARIAAGEGADAVGVVFWPKSKRFVEEAQAAEILRAVPAGVHKVGVFVNAHPLVVVETMSELGLDRVQLHGTEKPAEYGEVPAARIIKAIRVRDAESLKEAAAWDVGLYLYEGLHDEPGGTGQPAPWDVIAAGARRPFLLAGGLTAGNVARALRVTRADGVDVATGVESAPGIKDAAKLRAFIAAAREAADEITETNTPSPVRSG